MSFKPVNPPAAQTSLSRLAATATALLFLSSTTSAFTALLPSNHKPLSSTCTWASSPSTTVASTVLPSIALVEPSGVRNITSRGSAFVIAYPDTDDNTDTQTDVADSEYVYLLTAAHVASPGTQLHISFPPPASSGPTPESPPERLVAEVVGRDESSDLALVRVPSSSLRNVASSRRPVALALGGGGGVEEYVPLGTEAYAFGFPPGMIGDSPAVSRGIVCGMAGWPERRGRRRSGRGGRRKRGGESVESEEEKKEKEESAVGSDESSSVDDGVEDGETKTATTFVVTDAAMSPGMSGGPLTDSDGVVLGVCALVRMDVGGIGNYAVSADTCRRFIRELYERKLGEADTAETTTVAGYRVVLFNDRMNTRKQVDYILRDVAMLDANDAKSVMMSAHRTGRGVVRDFYVGKEEEDDLDTVKGRAESLCTVMRGADVLVEVEEIFNK